jgi:hypothetical protein
MEQITNLTARKELVQSWADRYTSAKRDDKQRILDEIIAVTNYYRKYAITLLNQTTE